MATATAACMISLAPRRATSSSTSLNSRPEPNNASISPRILSIGDTRDGTGVVLPVQTLAVLYGTYARRHLHRWMDTAFGCQPGITDAALLVLPPAIADAVPQQPLHRHQINVRRHIEGHRAVLFNALTGDSQRRERIKNPLPRAAQRTLPERDDPDRAIAGPLQPLVGPQLTVLVPANPDQVTVGHATNEPRRVLKPDRVRRDRHGPQALTSHRRPSVIVLRQLEHDLHETIGPVAAQAGLIHGDSMTDQRRNVTPDQP